VPLALSLMGRPYAQKAAKFAMGTRLGRHGHGGHGRKSLQPVGQPIHQGQCPLRGGNRGQGVKIAKARQPGHFLVEPGIMLHSA